MAKATVRMMILFLTLTALLGFIRIDISANPNSFDLKQRPHQLRQALLKTWLQRDHIFLSANHEYIEYSGRWTTHVSRLSREAGIPGSSARFVIANSTSLFIDLNKPAESLQDNLYDRILSGPLSTNTIEARAIKSNRIPPILVTVGEDRYLFHENPNGILYVSQNLASKRVYEVSIYLLESSSGHASSLDFQGIWLSTGGSLVERTTHSAVQLVSPYSEHTSIAPRRDGQAKKQSQPAQVIEIVSASAILGFNAEHFHLDHPSSHGLTYAKLLQENNIFNSRIVLLPIPPTICLTRKCHNAPTNNRPDPTIQDLYFRSGPANSPLFQQTWSWTSHPAPPTTLILDIGVTDFHTFLSTLPSHSSTGTKHALDSFTAHFATSLASFIHTIRRTSWRQRHSTSDPTYAYTSAPSDLKIFLLTPVLPPQYPMPLAALIHSALQTAILQLQRSDGDTQTFLIDRSGWLSESHFTTTPAPSPTPPRSPPQPPASSPSIPQPNALGHALIAQHLTLHLCPYISPDPSTCAFDRPDLYVGNLYVPAEDNIGKVLWEQRVRRVKEMVGLKP